MKNFSDTSSKNTRPELAAIRIGVKNANALLARYPALVRLVERFGTTPEKIDPSLARSICKRVKSSTIPVDLLGHVLDRLDELRVDRDGVPIPKVDGLRGFLHLFPVLATSTIDLMAKH